MNSRSALAAVAARWLVAGLLLSQGCGRRASIAPDGAVETVRAVAVDTGTGALVVEDGGPNGAGGERQQGLDLRDRNALCRLCLAWHGE